MNVVVLVVTIVGSLGTLYGISFPWRAHRAGKRGDRAGSGRRPHRPGCGRPLTHLVAPVDQPAASSLWLAIQLNRRAPLQYAKPGLHLKAPWHWFRRIYSVRETEPKGAFPIESWKYIAGGDPELDGMFGYGSGFVFEFRLANGENGHHLLRSVQSQKRKTERLIAVASAEEAANPDATVRCLVVDPETVRLSPADPRYVLAQSAGELKGGRPRVFTQRQGDVPEDALCLTHPAPRGRPPVRHWGSKTEEFVWEAEPHKRGGDGEAEDLEEARRLARRRRLSSVAKHAVFWAYWFGAAMYSARTSQDGSANEMLWQSIGGSLFVLLVVVVVIVLWAAVREALGTAHWFGGLNGPKSAWTGGTVTAAELGAMIGGKGRVYGKTWGRYVRSSRRTATGEPVLLKELGDKYLGVARRPLQEAIALTEHGENIYWDLLDLLVEADMCIPGPGLHTGGWAGGNKLAWPALDEYQALLKPLRYRQPLREVYKDPVSRLQVVQAAKSHLGACVDYAAGRPTTRGRHSLTWGLRGRSAKKALPPLLVSDMRSFAGLVDRIEPDDYTISVSEALHIYFLARLFGYKALDAVGGARRLAAALEDLRDECGGMEAIGSDELLHLLAEESDRPL